MPKTVIGVYIKTERSIKKLIEVLDARSRDQRIIIKDIDEYSCIISKDREVVKKVTEEIEKCQNKYLFDDQHLEN